MTSTIACRCGAKYQRTDTKFLVTHKGDAFCEHCGAVLESWDSTHVPSFKPVARVATVPARENGDSALSRSAWG
jgi:hypothetical protein